jgi:hypothetical protein
MLPISDLRGNGSRRLALLFTCIGLAILLAILSACGGSSSSLPGTYAAADQSHLAVISWQQNDQDLSGNWITWSTDTTAPFKIGLSGKVQNGTTVNLEAGGSVFQGNYNGQHLTLNGATTSGQFQSSPWTPLTQAQANQLSTAFMDFASLHSTLSQLQASFTRPPTDSDPYTYASFVQSAQSYVATLQERHDQIMSLDNPCGSGALALFRSQYPPDSSMFTLSNRQLSQNTAQQNAELVANNSTLSTQLGAVQSTWQKAHADPLPQVQVDLSWQISQNDERAAESSGQTQLSTLKQALTNDFTSMTELQGTAQHLANDVQSKAAKHGC